MTTTTLETPTPIGPLEVPFPISADAFTLLIDKGLIPRDRRVFLWDGRLLEKMAKSRSHAAGQDSLSLALSRRLPIGMFVGNEHPIQLDESHLPLPDLVVLRGKPLDFDDRYPDDRDILLVVEVAVTSLAADLGDRQDRYSRTLPEATYIVADIAGRRALIHTSPKAESGYATRTEVGPGGSIALRLGGIDIEPIAYEEVMR